MRRHDIGRRGVNGCMDDDLFIFCDRHDRVPRLALDDVPHIDRAGVVLEIKNLSACFLAKLIAAILNPHVLHGAFEHERPAVIRLWIDDDRADGNRFITS